MPRLTQRTALGVLFLALALGLGAIAVAAARHSVWVVAFAARSRYGWHSSHGRFFAEDEEICRPARTL